MVLQVTSQNLVYLYALGGNLALAVMQILFKSTSAVLTPFQVLYVRSFFLLFFSLFVLRQNKISPYIAEPQSTRSLELQPSGE
jgi:hypothetical protein